METQKIILIALIVLVVLSTVQAFEIASIKENGVTGTSTGYSQQKTTTTSGSSSYGSSPMVGGC